MPVRARMCRCTSLLRQSLNGERVYVWLRETWIEVFTVNESTEG